MKAVKVFKMFVFTFLSLWGVVSVIGAEGNKIIAVLPIQNVSGMDTESIKTLSTLLSSKLAQSKSLSILSGDDINLVLSKKKGYKTCENTKCLQEIGSLSKSDYIIFSKIIKLGGKYIISYQIVNVKTGGKELSNELSCVCKMENLDSTINYLAAEAMNKFGEQTTLPNISNFCSSPGQSGGQSDSHEPLKKSKLFFIIPFAFAMPVSNTLNVKLDDKQIYTHWVPSPGSEGQFGFSGSCFSLVVARPNRCFYIEVPSGDHMIDIPDVLASSRINAEPGQEYYVKLQFNPKIRSGFEIKILAQSEGSSEWQKCALPPGAKDPNQALFAAQFEPIAPCVKAPIRWR